MYRRPLQTLALILIAGFAHAAPPAQVTFVCTKGVAKSVYAAAVFDEMAAARGLAVRATSRGVQPASAIPPVLEARLKALGVDTEHFKPVALTAEDVAASALTIGLEVDVPPAGQSPVRRWDQLPASTEDPAAFEAEMRRRIAPLLDELAAQR